MLFWKTTNPSAQRHRRLHQFIHVLPLQLMTMLSPSDQLQAHDIAPKLLVISMPASVRTVIISASCQANMLEPRFTVRLQRMTNGLLSRSSTLYSTTKNRSRL